MPLLGSSGCRRTLSQRWGSRERTSPVWDVDTEKVAVPGTCACPTSSVSRCSEVLPVQERLGHLRPLPGRGAGDPGIDLGCVCVRSGRAEGETPTPGAPTSA